MSSRSQLIRHTHRELESESEHVARYRGVITKDWDLYGTPNGGYTLATALHCAQDFVARKRGRENADLFLCTAAYFSKAVSMRDYAVEVRILKSGKGTTNAESTLLQCDDRTGEEQIKLRVQLLFANFAQLRSDTVTVQRFSFSTAPFPFLTSANDIVASRVAWCKSPDFPYIKVDEKLQLVCKQRGEYVSAVYMYMPDENVAEEDVARFNITAIGMYSDMTARPWTMVPDVMLSDRKKLLQYRISTVSLSIEMRQPMPNFALRRVASFARTQHLNDGQWRFEVQVWSHPDDAQIFELPEGVPSVLLAISQQTALWYARTQGHSRM